MAEKKEVYVSGDGGTGLGLIAGIVLAAIALFAVLFLPGCLRWPARCGH